MDVDNLRFSSRHFLRLIESHGLTGTWGWRFADDHHVWSMGLFHILGLDPQTTAPSYGLLTSLIHPEDRDSVETAAEVIQGAAPADRTVRITCPDRSIRILSTRGEVYHAPDGRPVGAAGIILDVTDRERLIRARAAEQRRRRALFEQMRTLTFSTDPDYAFDFPQEAFELTGLSPNEIAADPYLTIVSEEREHWRGLSIEALDAGRTHTSTPLLHIAGGNRERFEVFTVPVRNAGGDLVDWSSLARPFGTRGPAPCDALRRGLEQAIDGRHLRAARALLDWSMSDLARSSGLSLSTVRRLEEDPAGSAPRTRQSAIESLRRAGIRFSLMEGGVIAVGRV